MKKILDKINLKTKRRIGALAGYPLTYLLGVFDNTPEAKRDTEEARKLFKARILGKRLDK